MVAKAGTPERKRLVYKTYLSLFPIEWAKLRAEAERRGITGREVIESVLSAHCGRLPLPKPPDLEPLPEAPPPEDDGV